MAELGFGLDDPLFRKDYQRQIAMHNLFDARHTTGYDHCYG